jgi:hypothetical protein
MQHRVHDEELFMEEALAAIRRVITDEEAGEMTLAPAEPRRSREEAGRNKNRGGIAVARSNCRSPLCVQNVDGKCEEVRTNTRGCGSRRASPMLKSWLDEKLASRGRANGRGRNRTGYSRTLTTIPAELREEQRPVVRCCVRKEEVPISGLRSDRDWALQVA